MEGVLQIVFLNVLVRKSFGQNTCEGVYLS